jgi:hypothetical protein
MQMSYLSHYEMTLLMKGLNQCLYHTTITKHEHNKWLWPHSHFNTWHHNKISKAHWTSKTFDFNHFSQDTSPSHDNLRRVSKSPLLHPLTHLRSGTLDWHVMRSTSADSSRLIHSILAHSSTLLHYIIIQSFVTIGHQRQRDHCFTCKILWLQELKIPLFQLTFLFYSVTGTNSMHIPWTLGWKVGKIPYPGYFVLSRLFWAPSSKTKQTLNPILTFNRDLTS